jgi:hypothetical protein
MSERRLISLFSRSSGLVHQIFFQSSTENAVNASSSSRRLKHRLDLEELPAEHEGDDAELLPHGDRVGLGEDGADRGRDHLGVGLRDGREHVTPQGTARPPAQDLERTRFDVTVADRARPASAAGYPPRTTSAMTPDPGVPSQ